MTDEPLDFPDELESLSIPTEDDAPTIAPVDVAAGAYKAVTGVEPSFDLKAYLEKMAGKADALDLRDPLRTTDLGNAERFSAQHHTRAKFCAGKWHVWDGRRWKRDDTEAVRRLARTTVKAIYAEAADIDDDKERTRMAKWAKQSESSKSVTAMLREAQADPRIAIAPDRMDPPETRYLLNCENGTVDIRTGEIRAHAPSDLITRLCPVRFDLSASCDRWNAFLVEIIPDPDTRAFLQRYIGSCLSGDTGDQQFVVMHGTGANGKSTLVSVILSMLGDYARQANFETFLASDSKGRSSKAAARPDLVAFKGARFVAAVEAGAGRRLDETTIKALTGGDLLTTRALYQEESTFQPECKVALVANNRPEIWGNDHAIWRRVLEIPFHVVIPEDKRDSTLKDALTTQTALSGILAWAALGALDWWERGTNRLGAPEAVQTATAEYRDQEDSITPFLDARCRRDPSSWVSGKVVWSAYLAFCEDEKINPVGRKTFARLLEGAGFRQARGRDSHGTRGFNGIDCAPNDPLLDGF